MASFYLYKCCSWFMLFYFIAAERINAVVKYNKITKTSKLTEILAQFLCNYCRILLFYFILFYLFYCKWANPQRRISNIWCCRTAASVSDQPVVRELQLQQTLPRTTLLGYSYSWYSRIYRNKRLSHVFYSETIPVSSLLHLDSLCFSTATAAANNK